MTTPSPRPYRYLDETTQQSIQENRIRMLEREHYDNTIALTTLQAMPYPTDTAEQYRVDSELALLLNNVATLEGMLGGPLAPTFPVDNGKKDEDRIKALESAVDQLILDSLFG